MKKRLLLSAAMLAVSIAALVSARAAEAKSKWAMFGPNKVHYVTGGASKGKNALVFVHGWTCSTDFWKDSVNAFPNYRVIAIDLPGHGQSDKPNTEYSMEFFARSIEAVMKNEKIEKAVLSGHSMGTPVVRQFYRIYPQKTIALIAVDGALTPMGPHDEVEKFFSPIFTNYKAAAPKFIDEMLVPTRADLRPKIRAAMLATPEHVGISAMKEMIAPKVWIDDKISVPVLAVMAASPHWPADLKDQYQRTAPDLEFNMWSGVSHFLMMEKPEEFNTTVKSFIEKKKLL